MLSGCSDKASENILRIHVSNAFDASKSITATGLSSDTIDGYRIIVSDDSTTIADSGVFSGSEAVLSGIVPGDYTFTVEGYIGSALVASTATHGSVGKENTSLSLPLKDIAPGNIASLSFRVYAPYDGEYDHTSDSLKIMYSAGGETTLTIADGTLTFAGEGSDDKGTYWSYRVTDAALSAGMAEIVFRAEDAEGKAIECHDFGVFFPDIGYEAVLDGQKGMGQVATPVISLIDESADSIAVSSLCFLDNETGKDITPRSRALPVLKISNSDGSDIVTVDVDRYSSSDYGTIKSKNITITEIEDGPSFTSPIQIKIGVQGNGDPAWLANWAPDDDGSKTVCIPDRFIDEERLFFLVDILNTSDIINEIGKYKQILIS